MFNPSMSMDIKSRIMQESSFGIQLSLSYCLLQLKSQVRCLECGYVSVRFDPFTFLSLPLPMDNSIYVEVIGECILYNKPFYMMDTSVKRTPRVGPCLSLLLLRYSL